MDMVHRRILEDLPPALTSSCQLTSRYSDTANNLSFYGTASYPADINTLRLSY